MDVSDGIGYILPEGDAYTDEFECCFIYVPAKDEYRRALFGALDYFATWLAWERDAAKRGKDAARAWKEANELTRECWEMGTCDLMVDLLQQLVDKESANACCVGNEYVTYNDNRVETTTIVVDQGAPPATYGETAVTDWDDWKEYVCFHAHAFVDDLVNSANKVDSLLDLGVWALDAAYWMMRQLVYRNPVWIVPIDLSWMTTIYKAILQGGEGYFDILADDIEDAREDIVCALINGTSLEDAVYSAIGGTLAWTLWYQFIDYDTTTAVIYNGGIDGFGYLTPIQRDDCDCVIPDALCGPLANCHWREDASSWTLQGEIIYSGLEGVYDGFNIDGTLLAQNSPTGQDAISDPFHWDGGRLKIDVLAMAGNSGTIAYWNTYVIVRVKRESDDVVVQTLSTTHGGGQAMWSTDYDITAIPVPEDDYYITITVDGAGGYPDRRIDYVGLSVYE